MLVPLGEMQPKPERHQSAGEQQPRRERLAEHRDGEHGADERGEREIGAGARGAEAAQGEDEEGQAHAIAEEADRPDPKQRGRSRQAGPVRQREQQVDGAGDESLQHRDRNRIGRGKPAREIIVDAPAQARSGDEQRAQLERRMALPGQQHRPAENRERAEKQAPIHVLAEQHPGDAHGRQAFEVEQQRRAGRAGAGEAEHQQHRPGDPARRHDSGQPWQIRAPQRRLDGSEFEGAAGAVDGSENRSPRRDREARPSSKDRPSRGTAWRRACSRRTARRKARRIGCRFAPSAY